MPHSPPHAPPKVTHALQRAAPAETLVLTEGVGALDAELDVYGAESMHQGRSSNPHGGPRAHRGGGYDGSASSRVGGSRPEAAASSRITARHRAGVHGGGAGSNDDVGVQFLRGQSSVNSIKSAASRRISGRQRREVSGPLPELSGPLQTDLSRAHRSASALSAVSMYGGDAAAASREQRDSMPVSFRSSFTASGAAAAPDALLVNGGSGRGSFSGAGWMDAHQMEVPASRAHGLAQPTATKTASVSFSAAAVLDALGLGGMPPLGAVDESVLIERLVEFRESLQHEPSLRWGGVPPRSADQDGAACGRAAAAGSPDNELGSPTNKSQSWIPSTSAASPLAAAEATSRRLSSSGQAAEEETVPWAVPRFGSGTVVATKRR